MWIRPGRSILIITATIFGTVALARSDDSVKAVEERLMAAKQIHTAVVERYKQAVSESLNLREETARKAGNKKLVEQIKMERTVFEKFSEVPAWVPVTLKEEMVESRANMTAAYKVAAKDYLRLKRDDAAETIEKEQLSFRIETATLLGRKKYLSTLRHYDVIVDFQQFSNNGIYPDESRAPLELRGELAPHSIAAHPRASSTSQVRYNLASKFTALRVTVGIPTHRKEGEAIGSAQTFEIVGDNKSLWKSKPITKRDDFDDCEISIEKVKLLTLRVHSSQSNDWAHTVWFEPTLFE